MLGAIICEAEDSTRGIIHPGTEYLLIKKEVTPDCARAAVTLIIAASLGSRVAEHKEAENTKAWCNELRECELTTRILKEVFSSPKADESKSQSQDYKSKLIQRIRILSQELQEANQGARKRHSSPADRAHYLNHNGEILFREGYYKLALEYFERALQIDKGNAWICQNLAESAARLPFKKGDLWESDQFGNTIDETGKWDVAVRHYRLALKLDPTKVAAHHQAQVFDIKPGEEGQIDNPIFIVGCGHSGTSLLLAILGNHPRINPIPKESALFLKNDCAIQKMMCEWDTGCKMTGKARWAEKTPPHIFQIHRFLALRPKSQIVIILRDGRDVVCSLKPRVGYGAFEDRLDRWIYDNMAGLPYWHHSQVTVVKYEDLVSNTKTTLRDLCKFLGEEYSPQLLEYHKVEHRWYSDIIEKPSAIKTHADHLSHRNWQINQPVFDGRMRWIAEMSDAEKRQFKDSPAQQLLEQLGYAENDNW